MAKKKQRYTFEGVGLTTDQKKIGREIYADYRKNYSIENYAQFQILEELIFREVQQQEVKKKIEQLMQSDNVKEKGLVPKSQFTILDENLERILNLKERLGMLNDDDESDFYNKFKSLKKKYKTWCMNHKADYTFKCPVCQEWIMGYIDLRKYGKTKHPYFKGNIVYNPKLWSLVDEGKITEADVAEILNVSKEYIPYANKGRKESNDAVKEEDE